jgi:hypothetical protein
MATFNDRTIMIRSQEQIDRAIEAISSAPIDPDNPVRFILDRPLPKKSRDQEQKYHAMIGDIARQYDHCGKRWDTDDMKRILIDQFKRDTCKDPDIAPLWASMGSIEMAPAFDGTGVVMLGVQSRKFSLKLASVFVEWLYALGTELNIKWSEK